MALSTASQPPPREVTREGRKVKILISTAGQKHSSEKKGATGGKGKVEKERIKRARRESDAERFGRELLLRD